jgi:acyl carrier protein
MSAVNGVGLERSAVVSLIVTSVKEALALAQGEAAEAVPVNEQTFLIGEGAVLDSLGLVTAVLEIERRLADEHEVVMVLADERAMSRRNSPFRSVQALADYICQTAAGEHA